MGCYIAQKLNWNHPGSTKTTWQQCCYGNANWEYGMGIPGADRLLMLFQVKLLSKIKT